MLPATEGNQESNGATEELGPAELLSTLRTSQATVAEDVAALVANLAPLGDAVEAIATALAEAQRAKAEMSDEKLSALHAIQVALEAALASIRAVNESDKFTEPQRIGGDNTSG